MITRSLLNAPAEVSLIPADSQPRARAESQPRSVAAIQSVWRVKPPSHWPVARCGLRGVAIAGVKLSLGGMVFSSAILGDTA